MMQKVSASKAVWLVWALLAALLALGLAGCGSAGSGAQADSSASSAPVGGASDQRSSASGSSGGNSASNGNVRTPSYNRVDIDLSRMSGQVAYGQVYQMMVDPSAYEGQVVRAAGPLWIGEYKGEKYPAVLIMDATACCANGFEFECASGASATGGLPGEGDEIVVTGVFELRQDGTTKWIVLADAVVG